MGKCHKCGNEYDRSFDVSIDGKTYTYDSFECAISEIAPKCGHCGCVVIGHGVQSDGTVYCCVNCAKMEGITELKDRA